MYLTFGKKRVVMETFNSELADFVPAADDPRAGEWSRVVALSLVLENLFKRSKLDPTKQK